MRVYCTSTEPFPVYGYVIIAMGTTLVVLLVAGAFFYRCVLLPASSLFRRCRCRCHIQRTRVTRTRRYPNAEPTRRDSEARQSHAP